MVAVITMRNNVIYWNLSTVMVSTQFFSKNCLVWIHEKGIQEIMTLQKKYFPEARAIYNATHCPLQTQTYANIIKKTFRSIFTQCNFSVEPTTSMVGSGVSFQTRTVGCTVC